MNSAWIALVFFVCTFGGAWLGMSLQRVLPPHHLSAESRRIVQLASGLIATLTALVLGLLVSSVHGSFDKKDDAIKRLAAQLTALDRVMSIYGPDAQEARNFLRQTAAGRFSAIFTNPELQKQLTHGDQVTTGLENVQRSLLSLVPDGAPQQWLQSRALEVSGELEQTRWLLLESLESSVPPVFLAVLLLWMTVIFVNFGLYAPRNITVLAAFLVCAVSVSSAIYLTLEMDGAFDGPIRISMSPLQDAIARLKQ